MILGEQFTIIEADLTHVGFLSDFGRKSFVDSYKCTLPLEELEEYTRIAFAKDAISDEITDSSANYFICQDSASNPCGYSKLVLSNPPEFINPASSIELQRLYVDVDYRGHGLGKLLAVHSETNVRNQGVRHLWLRVWEGNIAAQEIYSRWSYSIAGNEQYQVGKETRTVILMIKSLSTEY